MTSSGSFFAHWRVRFGYPLAVAVFWLARPAPRTIIYGGLIGALGLLLRAYSAGYLRKQESLTVSGPYAYTRNPLYLGSAILALGLAVITNSWLAALLIGAYFAVFYSIVMRREEAELRGHFGAAFEEYARRVPLFFPRLFPVRSGAPAESAFSWAQYKKNREYQAAIGFALVLAVLLLICSLRCR